tara:strand:- start:29 stop:361 length:333 start_codon:yes stop_codon:yes gene_type:complete
MKVYTDNWVNVKIINKHNPDTFEIPTNDELDEIKVDYSVKISNGFERFWVSVIEVKELYFIGKIDNILINNENYDYENYVMFERDNIYDIHDFEFKKMIMKYVSNKNIKL